MASLPQPTGRDRLNEMITTAQQPSVLMESRMTTPSLIILLGSTPAKAGLELCRQMLTLPHKDHRRVALVYIDTDDAPSDVAAFRKEHEGVFQEFKLRIAVPAGIDFATMPKQDMQTFIPAKAPQYFANGAGGIRNNGHVAAAFDHQKIVQTLESALVAIERLGTSQDERHVREMQVNIVAFLGGGTGSGILPDLAVIVRQMLVKRQYQQRLNLFCMLPEPIMGASDNDVSWRKSNATACLLEMTGLSLVAAATPGGLYEKFMFNEGYYVTDDPIANEVYLVGRTAMGSADDTARIVGLDLFQRLTDASGVGFLEHSTWVNRRSLGATDERGLPTMYGTSCPMEVRFPARETARAFAQISASYLLPHLVGQEPAPPPVTDADRNEWVNEWREVARLTPSTEGKPLAVRPPEEFSEADFEGATPETFTILWRELEQRRDVADAAIRAKVALKRQLEEEAIYGTPPAHPGDGSTVLGRQITHLQQLAQKYTTVLNTLGKNPPPDEPTRPRELEDAYLRRPRIPMPASMGEGQKQKQAGAITSEYNLILQNHARATRHALLVDCARALLAETEARLRDSLNWFHTDHLDRQIAALYTSGHTSHAWHGQLDLPHPHQRHLFDLSTLRAADDDRSIAVERLYHWVTFPPSQAQQGADGTNTNFGEHLNRRFAQRCMAYLANRATRGAAEDEFADYGADHLDVEGRERLADRVVDFFYDYYMSQLGVMNLFDLLAVGTEATGPQGRMQMSNYLLEHLRHMRGLMRSLIAFEETLWHDGPSRLDTTVYLSMRWDESKGSEKAILDRAVSELGALTERNQTPTVTNMIDPHRLEISYGQHGISLATVPDFYRDRNSSMSEYLRHQGAWFGSMAPVPPIPAPRNYGANKMPVHASGEMERIVCDPRALIYDPSLPHAPNYGTNLRGRVIREPARPDAVPNWENFGASGVHSGAGAGAGYGGGYSAGYGNYGNGPGAATAGSAGSYAGSGAGSYAPPAGGPSAPVWDAPTAANAGGLLSNAQTYTRNQQPPNAPPRRPDPQGPSSPTLRRMFDQDTH